MSDWPDLAGLDPALVARYDRRGPRYTSYPTAPHFSPDVAKEALRERLRHTSQTDEPAALSVYVHVPYCPSRCLYCGCHSQVIQHDEEPARYLDTLLQEVGLWADLLGPDRAVAQLSLGGGSPATLGSAGLTRLVDTLNDRFTPEPDGERSIELDPHRIDEGFLDHVLDLGFNRLSFGIQDFEPEVLRRVGRTEEPTQVHHLLTHLHNRRFRAIGFDLMIGLPGQTVETFGTTLDRVIDLGPGRIAIFPYAHVPWMRPHQQALEKWPLPDASERLRLYGLAHRRLARAGFRPIGMDHFAREDDELSQASRERRLHRNFMGYTTRPGLDLIGLGVSAISDLGATYVQHVKDVEVYRSHVEGGALPFERGFLLTPDDEARRALIMDLVCNFQANLDEIATRFGLEDHPFAEEVGRLAPFVDDGLVEPPQADGWLRVTLLGRPFVRLVCMVFDRYLKERQPTGQRYSKTL